MIRIAKIRKMPRSERREWRKLGLATILLIGLSLLIACVDRVEIKNDCPVPVIKADDCVADWIAKGDYPSCITPFLNKVLKQQDSLHCLKPENKDKKFCKQDVSGSPWDHVNRLSAGYNYTGDSVSGYLPSDYHGIQTMTKEGAQVYLMQLPYRHFSGIY